MIQVDTTELYAAGASLEGASTEVRRRGAQATRKAAFSIMGDARMTAPYRTGNLASSIGIEKADTAGLAWDIGPTAHYGAYQEYGTRYMSPRPYMRPSADRHTPAWQSAMAQVAAEAIQ